MRRTRLLAAALLAATACRDGELLTRETPYIHGTIMRGDSASVLVEATATVRAPGREDRAYVFVLPATHVQWRDGRRATRADLVPGRVVSVWITGIVRESYPVQVDATAILLAPGGA